jgi:hypothetical protein
MAQLYLLTPQCRTKDPLYHFLCLISAYQLYVIQTSYRNQISDERGGPFQTIGRRFRVKCNMLELLLLSVIGLGAGSMFIDVFDDDKDNETEDETSDNATTVTDETDANADTDADVVTSDGDETITPDGDETDGVFDPLEAFGLVDIGTDLSVAGNVNISLSAASVEALAALDDAEIPIIRLADVGDGLTRLVFEDGAAGDGYLHRVQASYRDEDGHYGFEVFVQTDNEEVPADITFDENGHPIVADGELVAVFNNYANTDAGFELYAGVNLSDPDDEISTFYGYDREVYYGSGTNEDTSGTPLEITQDGTDLSIA